VNELVGALVALVAAFGGAWFGGRLQRSNDLENITLQIQIDSAAKFIGSVGGFSFAYAQAWEPGTENVMLSARHNPIFEAILTLRSQAAAVGIVGPDDLAAITDEIVVLAAGRGLGTSFDAALFADTSLAIERFENEARRLRPTGQKNGRKSLRRRQESELPAIEQPL
jgi:hypothetical protein